MGIDAASRCIRGSFGYFGRVSSSFTWYIATRSIWALRLIYCFNLVFRTSCLKLQRDANNDMKTSLIDSSDLYEPSNREEEWCACVRYSWRPHCYLKTENSSETTRKQHVNFSGGSVWDAQWWRTLSANVGTYVSLSKYLISVLFVATVSELTRGIDKSRNRGMELTCHNSEWLTLPKWRINYVTLPNTTWRAR